MSGRKDKYADIPWREAQGRIIKEDEKRFKFFFAEELEDGNKQLTKGWFKKNIYLMQYEGWYIHFYYRRIPDKGVQIVLNSSGNTPYDYLGLEPVGLDLLKHRNPDTTTFLK